MAGLSVPEKLRRITTFYYGLSNPKARRWLLEYGMTDEEVVRGWELMTRAMRALVDVRPALPEDDFDEKLAELDAWENLWFPIIRASLEARFPAVARSVLLNLGRTSGPQVIVTVMVLLERLDALHRAPEDSEERRAFALLEQRGLSAEVRGRARGLLDQIKNPDLTLPEETGSPDNAAARVAEVWAWYQEWAAIARTVIPNKTVRIQLGVSRPARSKKSRQRSGGSQA